MAQKQKTSVVALATIFDTGGAYYLCPPFIVGDITKQSSNQLYIINNTSSLSHACNILPSVSASFSKGDAIIIIWKANMVFVSGSLSINGVNLTTELTGDKSSSPQFITLTFDGSVWVMNYAQAIAKASSAVLSVAGKTGAVTLAKADVGLGVVENTALSTWAGTSNITTVGTIGAGVWSGTAIVDGKIASASTWNAKASTVSPTFTGTPSAPTATLGTNTTQLATTQFVQSFGDNLQQNKVIGKAAINPTPTIYTAAGAGAGATATITGSDIGFTINLTTGTGCTASANVIKVFFGNAYATIPRAFLQARNPAANALIEAARVYPAEATDGVTLVSGTTPLTDSTKYIFNVMVIG